MEMEPTSTDEQLLSFSDLPEAVLLQILKLLSGVELATCCVLDTRLRELGSHQELWQALALARWPNASAQHYGGDWQLLFRHRVVLPGSFVVNVDRCHALTARAAGQQQLRMNNSSLPSLPSPAGSPAGSPVKTSVYGFSQRPFASIPGMLFEQLMQILFSVGLMHTRISGTTNLGVSSRSISSTTTSSSSSASSVGRSGAEVAALSMEMALVREDMAWWLGSKPEAIFQFARGTQDCLSNYDMWGSGFNRWPDALWRRSALQFLLDLQLGLDAGVCYSITSKLARECGRLDEGIRSVDAEASDLGVRPPEGLPPKHWWYTCKGQLAGAAC